MAYCEQYWSPYLQAVQVFGSLTQSLIGCSSLHVTNSIEFVHTLSSL